MTSQIPQQLIDELHAEGWESMYGSPEAASIYFGVNGNGPKGTTHFAFVDAECGWSIHRLDKWGGTGSRASIKMGDGDTVDELFDFMRRIDNGRGFNRALLHD